MDSFYLDKVFPEPDKIFGFEYQSYSETQKDCLFVVDTNILFVPFQTSTKGLSDIKRILKKLKAEERLFIPARVVREFAKNRGENLVAVYKKAEEAMDRTNRIDPNLVGNFPILSENEHFKAAKKLEGEINKKVKELRDKLSLIKDDVKGWNWNDPISKLYDEIFTANLIVDTKKTQDDLTDDLEFRSSHKVAPGFKDIKKIDKGIGDVIIWNTILELGKAQAKPVTFVTNEKKPDWFHSESKTSLYPKFELFDEFRRETNGLSLSVINFEMFLVSQDAEEETIEEIRNLYTPKGFRIIDRDTFIMVLRNVSDDAKRKSGFVGCRYFIETVLAEMEFDIGKSWEMFYALEAEGIIENYVHTDPTEQYPPVSAVRLKESS